MHLLTRTSRSYKTFLRDFALRQRNKETDDHPIALWLLYLLVLSYDVAFVAQAILRESIDRQLITMKRLAFEYATKAEYLFRFPDKALQQYHSVPLKQSDFLRRLGYDEANSAAAKALADEIARLKQSIPDVHAAYGEVSMFDMLLALDKEHADERYARHHWLPSTTMHGLQLGMMDVMRRDPDGKLWLSTNSLLTTRDQNIAVIVESLIRVLVLTGERFKLRGTHWITLIDHYNQVVRRLRVAPPFRELPFDVSDLVEASKHVPVAPAIPAGHNVRVNVRASSTQGSDDDTDIGPLLALQLVAEPTIGAGALVEYATRVFLDLLSRQLKSPRDISEAGKDLEFLQLAELLKALGALPNDLMPGLEALWRLNVGLSKAETENEDSLVDDFVEALPADIAPHGHLKSGSTADRSRTGRMLLTLELLRIHRSPNLKRDSFFEDILSQLKVSYLNLVPDAGADT